MDAEMDFLNLDWMFKSTIKCTLIVMLITKTVHIGP